MNIDRWREEAEKNSGRELPMVVVANKVDLEDSRVVSKEEGMEYAEKNEYLYVESSALTGENVEEVYAALCRLMIELSRQS